MIMSFFMVLLKGSGDLTDRLPLLPSSPEISFLRIGKPALTHLRHRLHLLFSLMNSKCCIDRLSLPLQVSHLPGASVDRLREVTRADLDGLLVVVQLEDRDGLSVEVPPGEPLDEEKELRVQGGIVQLGLNRKQIDAMEERIRKLLERVDAGEIEVF